MNFKFYVTHAISIYHTQVSGLQKAYQLGERDKNLLLGDVILKRYESPTRSSPILTPLLICDRQSPPQYKFIFLSYFSLPLKSKMAAIIFVKKILSSRPPKLRLLCRLTGLDVSVQQLQRDIFDSFLDYKDKGSSGWRMKTQVRILK